MYLPWAAGPDYRHFQQVHEPHCWNYTFKSKANMRISCALLRMSFKIIAYAYKVCLSKLLITSWQSEATTHLCT